MLWQFILVNQILGTDSRPTDVVGEYALPSLMSWGLQLISSLIFIVLLSSITPQNLSNKKNRKMGEKQNVHK